MGSLDSLKALLKHKKKEKQELVGDKKYIKKSELEEARLKRLREEEEQERRAKEEKRRRLQGSSATADGRPTTPVDQPVESPAAAAHASPIAADSTAAAAANGGPVLPGDEVIRRLRALGQPITLYGEEDADRLARLLKVEKTVKLVDETRGGQENVMLMLQRQEKLSKQKGGKAGGTDGASKADAAAGSNKAAGGADGPVPAADKAASSSKQAAGGSGTATPGRDAAGAADGSGDEVLKAFQEAAARVAAQRAEEALPIEDRIVKQLRGWCKEWEDDLEARSEEVKQSGPGYHATLVFKQSMNYFEPLYERLQKRQLVEELKVGLSLMVQHIHDRNYLAANDVYLKLAIGNAPWPIGVTHVGLHERSAREKISHVMNASSQAHIMNDEASRKFFQALKRLITNLQRIRPTDPSKCVDFTVHGDEGRGVAGGGSNREALLDAQQQGKLPAALPPAPHMLAADGSVKIPPKWDNVLKRQAQGLGIKHFGAGSGTDSEDDRPPSRGPAASRTPPTSPLPAKLQL